MRFWPELTIKLTPDTFTKLMNLANLKDKQLATELARDLLTAAVTAAHEDSHGKCRGIILPAKQTAHPGDSGPNLQQT